MVLNLIKKTQLNGVQRLKMVSLEKRSLKQYRFVISQSLHFNPQFNLIVLTCKSVFANTTLPYLNSCFS